MVKSYTEYFGFAESPFKRTPDIQFYFRSKSHKDALEALDAMLNFEDDFAIITAVSGAGKSLLLRKFIQGLSSDTIFAYIMFPYLQPQGLFQAVLEDFEIPYDESVSTNALYMRLEEFLKEQHNQGKQALLIIDEAQNLPEETLEELRILSNLETDKKKLLKIILAGQPGLNDKLESPIINDLKQRVAVMAELTEFTENELADYINFALAQAGGKKVTISKGLASLVWSYTKGNPRLVNMLMDKVLVAMFMDDSKNIRKEHILSAVKSMNTLMEKREQKRSATPAAVIIVLLAVLALAGFGGYTLLNREGEKVNVAVNTSPAVVEPVVQTPVIEEPEVAEPDEPVNPEPEIIEPVVVEPETVPPVVIEPELPEGYYGIDNIAVINANTLNVRRLPSTSSELIGILPRGARVTVKEENQDWIKVDLDNGREGWLFKRYLSKP